MNESSIKCGCSYWARQDMRLLTKHHPECEHYDLIGDTKEIIKALLYGVECWAADEDGIHDDCFKAYENAKIFISEVTKR